MAKRKVVSQKSSAEKPAPKPRPKPAPKPEKAHSAAGPSGGSREVRVRMYRHGLGDCFLLSFPRKAKKAGGTVTPFTILIDCGIIPGTPDGDVKMKEVVGHLKETTKGKVDVLVATHEHADHVSGFDPKKKWFDDFEFDQVWLAWTEDPDDKVANGIRADRRKKLAALWIGFNQLRQRLTAMGADRDAMANVERAAEVLSFFGIEAHDKPPSGGFGAAAEALDEGPTARAMTWVRTKANAKTKPRYWEPGDFEDLAGVEGVRVYALGPPKDLTQLHKDLPSSGKGHGAETYEDEEAKSDGAKARKSRPAASASSDAAERAFFASAFGAEAASILADQPGSGLPFDKKYRIEWEKAPKVAFFEDHYFGDRSQDWRRIDADWADGGASFALQLDGDTNNTSLALAFELPGGHVLLFPGDAQVGNWESWHSDSTGKSLVMEDESTGRKVTAESLLNRVVLYKVGHHGSHNATLREKGLEMMTRPDLSALVPVDAYVAHVKKRWTKMPFNPLMKRLGEKVPNWTGRAGRHRHRPRPRVVGRRRPSRPNRGFRGQIHGPLRSGGASREGRTPPVRRVRARNRGPLISVNPCPSPSLVAWALAWGARRRSCRSRRAAWRPRREAWPVRPSRRS